MLHTLFTTATRIVCLRPDRLAIALLCASSGVAAAAIDPDASAPSWWDASRAERIDYSNTVAAACKPVACSSSEIRYCLNDTLKPPVLTSAKNLSLTQVTASCIERLKVKK